MLPTKAIIELHYFSGGLKTILIGSPERPDWLPEHELVGLHNDIYPKEDEFVIEFSRHKRNGHLITWIGVYTKGVDAVYGDRSNYLGIGLWLTDVLPIDVYLIIDALHKICGLLIAHGPTHSDVLSQCNKFLDDKRYIQSWIRNILPRINSGIVFDASLHPATVYIQSTNQDIEASIKQIADSILLNCINAEEYIKGASRILYLLLNPTNKNEKISQFKQLNVDPTTPNSLVKFFYNSIEDIELRNQELEKQNHNLQMLNSNNSIQIENLSKELDELEYLNKINQKTSGQLIEDLKFNVKNLSALNNNVKNNLLVLIDAIDKSRIIHDKNIADTNIFTESYYNDLMSKLNDISKNINSLKLKTNIKQADFFSSNISSDNQSDGHYSHLSYRRIIDITLGVIILGSIFLLLNCYLSGPNIS